MFKVRTYTPLDYKMVSSWWVGHGMKAPREQFIPLDSSFIIYDTNKDQDVGVVSLILGNTTMFCQADNCVGNPLYTGAYREQATDFIHGFMEAFAKERGYKQLCALVSEPKLLKRYQQLGYNIEEVKCQRIFKPLT